MAALVLGGLTLGWRQGSLSLGQPALFVPFGLLVLAVANTFLRAKGLAWGIFTVALVLFMIIVGTWVVMDRAMKGPPPADFVRSTALYGFLAAAGLTQLRLPVPPKGDSPHEKK